MENQAFSQRGTSLALSFFIVLERNIADLQLSLKKP